MSDIKSIEGEQYPEAPAPDSVSVWSIPWNDGPLIRVKASDPFNGAEAIADLPLPAAEALLALLASEIQKAKETWR